MNKMFESDCMTLSITLQKTGFNNFEKYTVHDSAWRHRSHAIIKWVQNGYNCFYQSVSKLYAILNLFSLLTQLSLTFYSSILHFKTKEQFRIWFRMAAVSNICEIKLHSVDETLPGKFWPSDESNDVELKQTLCLKNYFVSYRLGQSWVVKPWKSIH